MPPLGRVAQSGHRVIARPRARLRERDPPIAGGPCCITAPAGRDQILGTVIALVPVEVIDCQQETAHLASLGARPWPRARFEAHLRAVVDQPRPGPWTYDEALWSYLDAPPAGPAS